MKELLNKDGYLELETYGKYNEEKDIQDSKWFKVPYEWAAEIIKDTFEMSVEKFVYEFYTWDCSETIYMMAKAHNVEIIED